MLGPLELTNLASGTEAMRRKVLALQPSGPSLRATARLRTEFCVDKDLVPPRRLGTEVLSTLAYNAGAITAVGTQMCQDTVTCKDSAVLQELEGLTRRIVAYAERVHQVHVLRLVAEWLREPEGTFVLQQLQNVVLLRGAPTKGGRPSQRWCVPTASQLLQAQPPPERPASAHSLRSAPANSSCAASAARVRPSSGVRQVSSAALGVEGSTGAGSSSSGKVQTRPVSATTRATSGRSSSKPMRPTRRPASATIRRPSRGAHPSITEGKSWQHTGGPVRCQGAFCDGEGEGIFSTTLKSIVLARLEEEMPIPDASAHLHTKVRAAELYDTQHVCGRCYAEYLSIDKNRVGTRQ